MLRSLLLPLFALGALATKHMHKTRADDDSFTLYAYGPGFGGLPVIYSEGLAYIGNVSLENSQYASVTFSKSASDETVWLVELDTDDAPTKQEKFFVPEGNGAVGFVTSDPAGDVTSGFDMLGRVTYVVTDDGLDSRFYVKPTDNDQVWAVIWDPNSDTPDDQKVPVALKNSLPSTA